MNGKAGTMTPEDFELLKNLSNSYSPFVLGLKVAKAASRISAGYLHEYPTSAVGLAWQTVGVTITNSLRSVRPSPVSTASFNDLTGLVSKYGPELVINKLAKIVSKSGAEPGALKTMFAARPAA